MDLVTPTSTIVLVGLAACAVFFGATILSRSHISKHVVTNSENTQQEKSSITATTPFQTPLPKPLEGYKLELTDPKLYRPFRHGPNFITMGIRKMDWNEWIEMDSNFIRYHDTKVSELDRDLDAHIKYVDNEVTRLACLEVLSELTQYLTHRYPEIFSLEGNTICNSVTGEKLQYPVATPTEALATAAKLVQDDLVLMVENDGKLLLLGGCLITFCGLAANSPLDGQYHLDAGAVCLPGFWRLGEKFRMSLDTLHIEAGVPHYQEKLMKSMNRFFDRMTPEQPVVRNNVSL
jgi:hypothetical protein